MLRFRDLRCPSGAHHVRRTVCARLVTAPSRFRRRGRSRSLGPAEIDFVQLLAHANWLTKSVLLILLLFSAVSWGIILYKTLAVSPRRAQHRHVPRGLPQEHQVL